MTPEQLLEAGYQEFNWNNGTIMEYWKPLGLNEKDERYKTELLDRRLCVKFGEWNNRPFVVWLYGPGCGIECRGVQTIDQLEQLRILVNGGYE